MADPAYSPVPRALLWSLHIIRIGLNRAPSSHTSSICSGQHEQARMFSLNKLKVYDKALTNAASLAQRSWSWDKRHAGSG
jgi:hypothetical protein